MRCLIAISFVFLSVWSIRAQPCLPMAVENATWIMTYGFNDYSYILHYAYRLQGDTIYDGKTYKKLYYVELKDNTGPPYSLQSSELIGLLRDDLLMCRVYVLLFKEKEDASCMLNPPGDVILYDHIASVGDTLRSECQSVYAIAMDIDTQHIYDADRRVWMLETNVSLIEGVGNSYGLFQPTTTVVHAGEGPLPVEYCVGTNFECGLYTATENISQEPKFQVAPNPVSDHLRIIPIFQSATCTLYSSTGQHISRLDITGSESVDVSFLPPGMFFIEIKSSKSSYMLKFVKQ